MLDIHAYKLHPEAVASVGASQDGGDDGNEEHPSSRVTVLPSEALDGLWEL